MDGCLGRRAAVGWPGGATRWRYHEDEGGRGTCCSSGDLEPGWALVLDASSAVAGGVRGVINTLDCSDAAEEQNRTEQHSTFTRVRVWVYYLLFVVVVVVAKPPNPCPYQFPR